MKIKLHLNGIILFCLVASIDWQKFIMYIKVSLCVLRLVLQAKGVYLSIQNTYFMEKWLVSAFPHFEETVHSWMVRGSGASTSGAGTYTYSWKSFDERVLLEPDSSSSSVNGPSNTEADESAQTSGDQNMDPEELLRKKVELHTLVREQLRHYCERGRPKWLLSNSAEMRENYSRGATHIISSLEIGPTISEHQCWIDHLRSNPTTLYELYQ